MTGDFALAEDFARFAAAFGEYAEINAGDPGVGGRGRAELEFFDLAGGFGRELEAFLAATSDIVRDGVGSCFVADQEAFARAFDGAGRDGGCLGRAGAVRGGHLYDDRVPDVRFDRHIGRAARG